MKRPDVVAVNANDPQAGQLDLLVRTLRDPLKGAFSGRIWLVTTGISKTLDRHLARFGVEVLPSDLTDFTSWKYASAVGQYEWLKKQNNWQKWRTIADRFPRRPWRLWNWLQHASKNWDERALTRLAEHYRPSESDVPDIAAGWDLYIRKHFSKFGLLPHLASNVADISSVMLLDSDIIFQAPIESIFDAVPSNKCLVEYEAEPITGDTPIAMSNRLAARYSCHRFLKYGDEAHEVNVGFLCAEGVVLQRILQEWKNLILHGGFERLFIQHSEHFWHEQDFFRLLHDMNPEKFEAAGKYRVYHAVHAAACGVSEGADGSIRMLTTGLAPTVVHFAGGYWRGFKSIAPTYEMNAEAVAANGG